MKINRKTKIKMCLCSVFINPVSVVKDPCLCVCARVCSVCVSFVALVGIGGELSGFRG